MENQQMGIKCKNEECDYSEVVDTKSAHRLYNVVCPKCKHKEPLLNAEDMYVIYTYLAHKFATEAYGVDFDKAKEPSRIIH